MFMRFRGGGVGHKSTCEATQCLIGDREDLDKRPFTLERERGPFEGSDGDDVPMEGSSSAEEEESNESNEDGSDVGGVDARDGQQLVDDELADEMDEFGYTRLDQVVEDEVASGDEDALGPDNEVDDTF